jgi:hypothetical protein
MQPSCENKSPENEFDARRNGEALASRTLGSARKSREERNSGFSVETRTREIPPSFTMELESLMPEPHSKNIL